MICGQIRYNYAQQAFVHETKTNPMHNSDFSFDNRVAQIYNRQRNHPPEVSQAIGAAIAAQAGQRRVLEIGVGTGRIAWPVATAGAPVVGFDISTQMMDEIHATRPNEQAQLDLLTADMHHMPFTGDSFGAVMAIHVLHLATDWQRVLREIARVLQPDGVLVQGEDWIDPDSVVGQLRNLLRDIVIEIAPNFRPPAAGVSRKQFLADLGGTQTEEVIAAEWQGEISPAQRLQEIEARIDAESWILPDDLFDTVFARLQDYAAKTWPNLEETQPVTRRFVLKVTRGSWQSEL